ncbi:hypothetical protein [Flavihumibacter solisilvae]|uniref:hypothetical protein n=1 Tax=Flavihumibacter solisilvae TaxID=1349421 RepID=UPI000AC4A3C2|nr:hypothetical protein [Flavihumibacter solisilvae]
MDLLTALLGDIFLSFLGRVILFTRYRNRRKVLSILASLYDNSFAQVARIYAWQFIAGLMFAGFLIILIVALISLVRH